MLLDGYTAGVGDFMVEHMSWLTKPGASAPPTSQRSCWLSSVYVPAAPARCADFIASVMPSVSMLTRTTLPSRVIMLSL